MNKITCLLMIFFTQVIVAANMPPPPPATPPPPGMPIDSICIFLFATAILTGFYLSKKIIYKNKL